MTKDKEEFSILKELWFPLLFGFILVVLMAGSYFLTAADTKTTAPKKESSKELGKTVTVFLVNLKKGDKEKAYESVSKEFQEAMPFPKFVQFLSDYPILTIYDKVEPGAASLEGQTALFPVVLYVGTARFPVNFTLVQERGEWKILGFVINQMTTGRDLRDLDSLKPLSGVVKQFLGNLSKGDLENTYQNDTSEEFKKGTSLQQFIAYVGERPIFKTETSTEVIDGHIDAGRGYLQITLRSGKEAIPTDFTLKEEKGGWKIDGIFFLAPAKEEKPKIDSGIIGTFYD